jgi:zinc transporter 5/7
MPSTPITTTLKLTHAHEHENQNMQGIFLHILADTMGSAAVIVSTLLIRFVGWSGWDALASCIIAILIFLSSLPLVSNSAKQLLLTVPADTEYKLRNTLADVSGLRGVASYHVPRFWMKDKTEGEPEQVLGVMHLVATKTSNVEDVRQRARDFLLGRGIDVVIQVDKEGEARCWCGGDVLRSSSSSTFSG